MVSTQAKDTGNVIHVLEAFQRGEAEAQLRYKLEWSKVFFPCRAQVRIFDFYFRPVSAASPLHTLLSLWYGFIILIHFDTVSQSLFLGQVVC
jgi:hypothetical protein